MGKFSLLYDLILYPNKMVKQRTDIDSNPSRTRKYLIANNLLYEYQPNFHELGFVDQAFVDAKIYNDAHPPTLMDQLHKIIGVIETYTMFGEIDVRCKIVGRDHKALEKIALAIRELEGVKSANTTILIESTDHQNMRENWARLILENQELIKSKLPRG